jgi:hypothetical protein
MPVSTRPFTDALWDALDRKALAHSVSMTGIAHPWSPGSSQRRFWRTSRRH